MNYLFQSSKSIFLLVLVFLNMNVIFANPNTHLSTIVLDANPEKTKEIVKQLLTDNQITLEYDCSYSGVIVVKMKHSFSEVGDVKGYINNVLGALKPGTIIIFCDLHDVSFEGKC